MLSPRHIPNAICVFRILLIPPIIWFLLSRQFGWAIGLIFTAGMSDALDGYLAKHYGWRSRLGGLLDPAADKLLMLGVFLTLVIMDMVPVWLAVVVIGRDLVIVSGALAYGSLIGPVEPSPSRVSKLNTGLQLLYVLAVLAGGASGWPPDITRTVLGAGVLVTSVVSGIDYVLHWSALARAGRGAV